MLQTEMLCFQCMHRLNEPGSICPHCGYDNRVRVNDNGYLGDVVIQGQYYIGKALGRGGFGITYRAMDLYLERVVAIKEYFPATMAARDTGTTTMRTYTGSEQEYARGCQRAMDEGRMVARIGHVPGVVQIHNVFQANNTVYIVMEYVGGMTLANLVRGFGGRMPWQVVYALLEPLMRSLHTIHGMQIIHRDVSPDNIMIRNTDGTAVLLDFGAAHHVSDDAISEHSVSLRIGYAPAEQYSSVGKQDGRIDEYALCATMYFALTGMKPPDATERLYAGTPLRSLGGSGISQAMEAVLYKGMAVRADDRFPDIAALRAAFLQFQQPSVDVLSSVLPVVRGQTVYPQQQPLPDSRSSVPGSIPRTGGMSSSVYAERVVPASQAAQPDHLSDSTLQAPPELMQTLERETQHSPQKKSRARVIVPIAATAAAAAVAVGVWYMKQNPVELSSPAATVMMTDVPTEAPTPVPTEAPTEVPTEAPTATFTPGPLDGMAAGDTIDMDGIVYRMLEDDTLEVADYSINNTIATIPGEVWGRKVTGVGFEAFTDRMQLEGVALNANVAYIDTLAFAGSTNLKTIALPDTLREIRHGAFQHCESLEKVNLPDGVTTIEEAAFLNCYSLTYARIPESVSYIGPDTFAGCDQLALDVVPGSYAENYAREFGISIFGEEPAEQIVSEGAFEARVLESGGCEIVRYTGADSDVVMPQSIEGYPVYSLGERCMEHPGHNPSLNNLVLPEGLERIESEALAACSDLRYIYIPASVNYIGEIAFADCPDVQIHCEPGSLAEQYALDNGIALYAPPFQPEEIRENGFVALTREDGVCNLIGYEGDQREFDVPAYIQGYAVNTIAEHCFAGHEELVSVLLPDTVREIHTNAFTGCTSLGTVNIQTEEIRIFHDAFAGCSALEMIDLPENSYMEGDAFPDSPYLVIDVPMGSEIEQMLLDAGYQTGRYTWKKQDGGCAITGYEGNTRYLKIPAIMGGMQVLSIENGVFQNHQQITRVLLPDGLKSIGPWAFDGCVNLTQVALPKTLQSIETRAFRNTALGRVDLPDGLKRIMSLCFSDCPNLKLYVTRDSVGHGYARANELNHVVLEDGTVSHPDDFAYGTDERGAFVRGYFGTARTVCLPAYYEGLPVYAIADSAFFGQVNLECLHAEDTLQEIHDDAFAGCGSLSEVLLPEHVSYNQTARYHSFAQCPERSETVQKETRFYAKQDGYGCVITGAEFVGDTLIIPSEMDGSAVYAIGYNAFSDLPGLRQVVIPEGVKSIEGGAFSNCTNLHTVLLPESLNVIGGKAFADCPSLSKVTLPAGLKNVVTGTFKNCGQLQLVVTEGSVGQRYAQTWHIDYILVQEEE